MKFNEIGSNFYGNKQVYADKLHDEFLQKKYGLKSNIVYPSLGRNAISIILKNINNKKKVALLPGYTCESVIHPYLKEDYKLVFYNFRKDLTIDIADLDYKIKEYKPNILHIHGFYGYNTFLNAKQIILSAKEKGCVVIQDDTQTVFSDTEIMNADYYIGSLRKWMEIPDGAYIFSNKRDMQLTDITHNKFINMVVEAFKLKAEYVNSLESSVKTKYKKLFLDAQNIIDKDLSIYKMSDISKGIFNTINISDVIIKRVENYNYLFRNIFDHFQNIKPVLSIPVSPNICPIYFPLYVKDRDKFQKTLSDNDIYATIIWPKYYKITGLKEETEYIYNNIIGIPCDQRYNDFDMQRVIEVLHDNFI